ncbi:DUF5017 domain-containing protein [Pinibacter aurantiacus]|uniref:DUF5017 domain-containing protein n=1 Tax=Pinibacter aurantiacus TaxID=2851599 RepID=A0A9E2SB74_9BACT|nr:DUF5017 domain-containing protein [Pinibacter aurantiacus]MBV4358194.1 DUF5017 domain-containing protein [Pinibacter aurantiacus]
MLSYRNIIATIIAVAAITSCNKSQLDLAPISSFDVQADSMNVSHDGASYSLGSPAIFNFTGNPAAITFFSGEVGHRYNYRNRTSATGISRLIFTNALNAGTQANSLHVMLSTDFKGVVGSRTVIQGVVTTNTLVYDTAATQANIAAASWTDVTPSKLATNATAVIDTIDLSAYAAAGKKVFVAFKYTAQAGSVQNKWTITNLTLSNNLTDGTIYNIGNLAAYNVPILNYGGTTFNAGWMAFPVSNTYNWAITAGSSLVITGASTAAAATSNAEAWTLMGGCDLTTVTPDIGVAVKNISVAPLPFKYLYTAAGKYDAVFAATNLTTYTQDSITRKIPIVIK